jgi:ribonuclease J
VRVTIHRGSREIGGSCVELAHGDDRILLDLGMPLTGSDVAGADGRVDRGTSSNPIRPDLLPRSHGFFPEDKAETDGARALFLSHAHADHYGLCEHLRPAVPIRVGAGALKLIDLGRLIAGRPPLADRCICFSHGIPVTVGSFKVTPILVDHSVFDAFALVVEAGGKTIVYTGDFRNHGRKPAMLPRFLRMTPKGADALLIEGTLVGNEESGRAKPESEVEEELVGTFRNASGYVLVAASSQNVDRIVSLYRAAVRTGRTLVVDVHTANILADLAVQARLPYPSKSYARIRVCYPRAIAMRYAELGHKDRLYRFRPFKITRGEMAERPSMFVILLKPSMIREANSLPGIAGATLVWSQWGGYLRERSTERLRAFVESNGIRLVHHHTGGHADPATLRKVIRKLDPKRVVPIHTANPAGFREFAENVSTAEDGVPMEI